MRSGPPSPANIRVGSSPWRLSSNTPAVYGNSPGRFSCNCHRRMSPQSLYLGNTTFGILVLLNDLVVSGCLMILPRTSYSKKSLLYFFTTSGHACNNFLQSGCKASSSPFLRCSKSARYGASLSEAEIVPLTWYHLVATAHCSATHWS